MMPGSLGVGKDERSGVDKRLMADSCGGLQETVVCL